MLMSGDKQMRIARPQTQTEVARRREALARPNEGEIGNTKKPDTIFIIQSRVEI
jgi:hypothetical protein